MTRIAHIGAMSAAFLAAIASVPGVAVSAEVPTASSHPVAKQFDAMAADRRRQARREAQSTEWNRLLRMVRWKYPKPGHSVKQGQRMARKARNRRRSK